MKQLKEINILWPGATVRLSRIGESPRSWRTASLEYFVILYPGLSNFELYKVWLSLIPGYENDIDKIHCNED